MQGLLLSESTSPLPGLPVPLGWLGRSFAVTSLLPSMLPVFTVALLLGSDAWSGEPKWRVGLTQVVHGGWATGGCLLLASVALAMVLHPLTPALSALFEGHWGTTVLGGWLASFGVSRHRALRLTSRRGSPDGVPTAVNARNPPDHLRSLEVKRRRALHPTHQYDVRPTALGNAQFRQEVEAGAPYGLNARALATPLRLISSPSEVESLDDARLRLDLALRLVITCLLTCCLCTAWLWRAGAWMLVALVPYVAALLLYKGAVTLAAEYGAVLGALLHLNRLELYRRMGLADVATLAEERERNKEKLARALRVDEQFTVRAQTDLDLSPPSL
jgi:hypothetical protein